MKVAVADAASYEPDVVRSGLAQALAALGLDTDNPFAGLVSPGQTVFVKPNWVAHRYRASCPCQDSLWSTITHPEVILAVTDLVARALDGKGKIVIGDNPSIDADFPELIAASNLGDVGSRYDVACETLDLRPLVCRDLKDYGLKHRMHEQPGDPRGVAAVNLGRESLLAEVDASRFRGVFTDRSETVARHSGDEQWYEFSRSIVDADVYISVPKLKTHHKVGTTLNLKGLVGTQSNKNLLVHWREGFPGCGGDEYPDEGAWKAAQSARITKRGAWPGNDTIWRMVVDLYTALRRLRGGRPMFTVIDGITGGEGEGPFCPRSVESKVLLASADLLAADAVATRLMGLRVAQIPYLGYYLDRGELDLAAIAIEGSARVLDDVGPEGFFASPSPYLGYQPPTAWKDLAVA